MYPRKRLFLKLCLVLILVFVSPTSAQNHDPVVITVDNAAQVIQLAIGGQGRGVYEITWNTDGDTLALTTARGTWLYRVAEPQTEPNLIAELYIPAFGHQSEIAAFGLDTPTFIGGSAALVDTTSYDVVFTIDRHDASRVNLLSFSPDDTILALGDYGGHVELWRMDGYTLIHEFALSDSPIMAIAFNTDGTSVAVGNNIGEVSILNVATGDEIGALSSNEPIRALGFQGDTLIAIDSAAQIFRWSKNSEITDISPNIETGIRVQADLDVAGHLAAIELLNGDIVLWDINEQVQVGVLQGHAPSLDDLVFSPDGSTLASVGLDGTIRLWNVESLTEQYVFVLEGHPRAVSGIVVNQTRGQVISTGYNDGLRVWNLPTLMQERAITFDGCACVTSVALSPDDRILATGQWDSSARARSEGSVNLLDTSVNTHRHIMSGSNTEIRELAFNPSGTILATGGWDTHQIRFWDIGNDVERPAIQLEGTITTLFFVSDDRVLSESGIDTGIIQVWDVNTLDEVYRVEGYRPVFNANSQILAIGRGSEDTVIFINAVTGEIAYESSILGLPRAFNPTGEILVTNYLGEVYLWNATTRDNVAVIEGHIRGSDIITFDSSGAYIITGGGDGTIRLWGITSE